VGLAPLSRTDRALRNALRRGPTRIGAEALTGTASTNATVTVDQLQSETAVTLEDVTKVFNSGQSSVVAVERLSLEVCRGELVCLLGASGCGKSTVLNLIAKLEQPTRGRVAVPAGNTAMVFQETALMPWLTVAQNVEMPLRIRGRRRHERAAVAQELLELVRLDRFAKHRPHQLSGGMRQRVALARALAQRSEVLLMDEPFGAVDAITRDQLHEDLVRIRAETGVTIVFVTHSVRESVRLGDRIVVLSSRPGRVLEEFAIEGDGSPAEHERAGASLVPRITDLLWREIGRHAPR
jgi:NitT/TauT family transport system ATP-binding protein